MNKQQISEHFYVSWFELEDGKIHYFYNDENGHNLFNFVNDGSHIAFCLKPLDSKNTEPNMTVLINNKDVDNPHYDISFHDKVSFDGGKILNAYHHKPIIHKRHKK